MCGRAVQSRGAVFAASKALESNPQFKGSLADKIGPRIPPSNNQEGTCEPKSDQIEESLAPESDGSFPWHDNFNLSPGHDAVVFSINKQGELEMSRKIWGLVTKGGTTQSPIPKGPSKHFANLMFNARSDTLFSKPTFSKLLNEGKTCLVAFDGFFEWKADALGGGKGKKQPYFVFRKNADAMDCTNMKRPYLLMAGLWTSVPTGYSPPEPPTLDTFTILTTDVCDPLKWLHSRMPVCVWDEDLAMQWLRSPTQKLHEQLDQASRQTCEDLLQWHAVTTQMSSVKFRSPDAIKPLPKPKSVKSFFVPVSKKEKAEEKLKDVNKLDEEEAKLNDCAAKEPMRTIQTTTTASPKAGIKRSAPTKASPSSTNDKTPSSKKSKTNSPAAQKGSITSFFSPKKSTK